MRVFGIPVPLAMDADCMHDAPGPAPSDLGDHVCLGGHGSLLEVVSCPSVDVLGSTVV